MTDAITELVELFDAEGAFIFIHHQGRPCPAFEVVSANVIRDFGCPHVRRHYTGVLLAMDDLYTNESQLIRTIQTIAIDRNIITVYTESVRLAEYLASEARRLWEARLDSQNVLEVNQNV
ncbi:hypothetical protein F4604DRAFT_1937502 [Suillus subluteus]|nr:hypothetical protein F4604DRAFT_1937502 [Suillus subluteus]